jgi:hypothetical protein
VTRSCKSKLHGKLITIDDKEHEEFPALERSAQKTFVMIETFCLWLIRNGLDGTTRNIFCVSLEATQTIKYDGREEE